MNLIEIIAFLQVVLSLLAATTGTPLEPQARELANQAIIVAQQAVVQNYEQPTNQNTNMSGEVNKKTDKQKEDAKKAPAEATIEIISPIVGKGLGREYKASDEIVDESNYIELGVVCTHQDGKSIKDAHVTVVATDTDQNKVIEGTGNVTKVFDEELGDDKSVFYYPFHYEFKTAGTHKITFTCDGIENPVSVDLEVK